MKTQLVSYFILSFCVISLFACNPRKAIEEKIAKEMAGAMLGTDIDVSNVDNSKPSSAIVNLKKGSESISFKTESAVFNVVKEKSGNLSIGTSLLKEEEDSQGGAISIILGVTGDASLWKNSSTFNFDSQKKDKDKMAASIMINKVGSEEEIKSKGMMGIQPTMVETGTMKIVKFTEEEIIFEIDAKAKDLSMKEEEVKENSITGTITCKNPIITFMGISKDEVFK